MTLSSLVGDNDKAVVQRSVMVSMLGVLLQLIAAQRLRETACVGTFIVNIWWEYMPGHF